jgi:glycerol kinase
MVGQGCLSAGQIKATYGTGCFINLHTGAEIVKSNHQLLTMLAWQRSGLPSYGLDGGVFTAAASINWLKDKLNLLVDSASIDSLCNGESDTGGVMWIPAQIGLGAPYWSRNMRGAWLGLDLTTNRAQLIRAVLEGVAARVAQIIRAMLDDAKLTVEQLRVDGGLTRSTTMMQIQANLLGFPVAVLENPEATVSGVCALAARATNLWESDAAIQEMVTIARVYEPMLSHDEREAYLSKFDRAVMHLEAWHSNE